MPIDDDLPRPKEQLVSQPPLDRLGVDELRAYVAGLRAEIVRAEGEIGRKTAMRTAADSFFRT